MTCIVLQSRIETSAPVTQRAFLIVPALLVIARGKGRTRSAHFAAAQFWGPLFKFHASDEHRHGVPEYSADSD
jgi:hypothetical protein